MKTLSLAFALFLLASAAQAQSVEQQVKTQIASQLGELIIANAALSAQVSLLTKENDELKRQIEGLAKKEKK
jgi:hypothetical protein